MDSFNINVEYSRLEFNSIGAEEFLNTRIQKDIKEMDIIISTGDIEQGRRKSPTAHPTTVEIITTDCPTQLQRNHHTITKTHTVRQGRDSGGQIIWYRSKFHNHINTVKQGKYYTWLKIHKELLSSRNISVCHIHPAIRVPLLQRRHVLHIRGRDEPLPGPGKRAHLRGPEHKNRTKAGLHRHTREQIHQQQTDCY